MTSLLTAVQLAAGSSPGKGVQAIHLTVDMRQLVAVSASSQSRQGWHIGTSTSLPMWLWS